MKLARERVPADFGMALSLKLALEADEKTANEGFKEFEGLRASMGLLPDTVLFSAEYQSIKSAWRQKFDAMREYNSLFLRVHKKAYNAHIQQQRMERLNAK